MRESERRAQIQRLTSRAAELAGRLDVEVAPATRPRYFRDPSLAQAVERVAEHDGRLTFVVGAGASMEADLPSWSTLIRRLLEQVGADRFASTPDRDEWIGAIEDEGLLAAAAIAEVLAPSDDAFRTMLRDALYGDRPMTQYFPQALTREVARLKSRLGGELTIATGNFDGLLEAALNLETDFRVRSYVVGRAEEPGEAAVYHLHGRLMPEYSRTGQLVLSEASYSLTQTAESWQDRFMSQALTDTLCVFLGLSFSDPNLIRWVYRNARQDAQRHIALFVRQASPGISDDVRPELERAARARWDRCRVDSIWVDFFGEVAQFVHEVGLRRSGSDLPSFSDRARERFQLGRGFVVPEAPETFGQRQDKVSGVLQDLLDAIRDQSRLNGVDLADEVLGLALWGLDHEKGELWLWANSDRRYNDPDRMMSVPLLYESEWVAVEAVTNGTVIQRDPGVYTSPWRLIRGIPIVVSDDATDERVVVGAMTFTSRTTEERSRMTQEILWAIDDFLGEVGSYFFQE
jgi:hypothetical protein